jgi:hypothetical protein
VHEIAARWAHQDRGAAAVTEDSIQLIAETSDERTFVLDCLVANDGEMRGAPLALVLARPETGWFDKAVENLLTQWADNCKVVRVQFLKGHHGVVAVLEPEDTPLTVSLDVLRVA